MRAKSHNVAVLAAALAVLAASGAGAATVRMDENTLINLRAPAATPPEPPPGPTRPKFPPLNGRLGLSA